MIVELFIRGPYLLHVFLLLAGVYILLTHHNLLKALIGVSLVQSSIILFFVSLAVRKGGTVPIVFEGAGPPLHNPLPHALMLTAIVVGVATLGVGLAILGRLYDDVGSLSDVSARNEEQ